MLRDARGTNTGKTIRCERRLRTFRLHRAAPARRGVSSNLKMGDLSENRGLGLSGWVSKGGLKICDRLGPGDFPNISIFCLFSDVL